MPVKGSRKRTATDRTTPNKGNMKKGKMYATTRVGSTASKRAKKRK